MTTITCLKHDDDALIVTSPNQCYYQNLKILLCCIKTLYGPNTNYSNLAIYKLGLVSYKQMDQASHMLNCLIRSFSFLHFTQGSPFKRTHLGRPIWLLIIKGSRKSHESLKANFLYRSCPLPSSMWSLLCYHCIAYYIPCFSNASYHIRRSFGRETTLSRGVLPIALKEVFYSK